MALTPRLFHRIDARFFLLKSRAPTQGKAKPDGDISCLLWANLIQFPTLIAYSSQNFGLLHLLYDSDSDTGGGRVGYMYSTVPVGSNGVTPSAPLNQRVSTWWDRQIVYFLGEGEANRPGIDSSFL